ncbi:MAG: hypothetical protein MUF86_16085, partial [Akkermansiaceae bacterium]|nr:hypothetical protein [Akkermansiaceae bacterium]
MKPIITLLTALLLTPLAALRAADNTPYPVAKFSIEHAVINEVYPAWSPHMGYNHDSDITRFKGRYVAAWNANPETPEESRPGQRNYLSVSDDFQHWSVPVEPFTSKGRAVQPVDPARSRA